MRQGFLGVLCPAVTLLALGSLGPQASAVVLLNDTFADADRTETNLPGESAVYVSHPNNAENPNRVTMSPGSLTYDVDTASTTRLHTYFAPDGSPVQIGVGQKLVATIGFTTGSIFNSNSRNFRVGLFSTSGVDHVTADGANDAGGGSWLSAQGYAAFLPLTGTPGTTELFHIGKRTQVGAGNLLGSAGDYVQNSSGGGVYAATANTAYSLRIELDRTATTQMAVTFELYEVGNASPVASQTVVDDAANFGNAVNATNPYTNFDMLAFRFSGSGAGVGDQLTFTSFNVQLISALLLGDGNNDGVVDGLDIPIFLAQLNGSQTPTPAMDLNQDSVVDGLDIPPFLSALAGGTSAAVPEPASVVVLGLGGLALLRRRAA